LLHPREAIPVADPVDADSIAQAANEVASATVDGQSATAVPIDQQIAAAKFKAAQDALAGANAGGGAKSGWGALRPAVARFKGGT
jgi:hypothetical protein